MSVENTYEPPRNSVEATVAEIWAQLLDIPRVGSNDNFLLLGGESLLAVQAASQIRKRFGYEISVRSIFLKTVSEISEEIPAVQSEPKAR